MSDYDELDLLRLLKSAAEEEAIKYRERIERMLAAITNGNHVVYFECGCTRCEALRREMDEALDELGMLALTPKDFHENDEPREPV